MLIPYTSGRQQRFLFYFAYKYSEFRAAKVQEKAGYGDISCRFGKNYFGIIFFLLYLYYFEHKLKESKLRLFPLLRPGI